MSLLVWLPLNGDLKNLGSADITITNNGATADNNGKIGQCYYFDGTSSNYMTTTYSTAIGTNDFSIAMWVKIPTLTSGSYYAICTSKTSAAAGAGFGIYWNYSQKKFLWSTADGSGATEIWMANTVDTIVYDKWIHLVMVRNNSDSKKGYFYINGTRYELASVPPIRNITTDTKINLGRCTNNTYFAKMYLNDFRIYDHALSTTEVHELAQGLILHYKFDNNSLNLINKDTLTEDSMINSAGNVASTSKWYVTDYIPVISGNHYQTLDLSKGGSNTYIGVYNSSKTKTRTILITANQNNYFTIESDEAYVRLSIRNFNGELANAGFFEIPSIIIDDSGYGHNGEVINDLKILSNTSRYRNSFYFSNSSYIKKTNFNLPINIWTVSCWYYRDSNPSSYEAIFALSKGNGSDANKKIAAIPNNGYIWFKGESGSTTASNLNINAWTMLTMTCDGTTVKIYENGSFIKNFSAGTHMTDCTDLVIGARANSANVNSITVPYTGGINDFRIYCTPLLDNDIKLLYNTSVKINKLGGVHTFCVNEVQTNEITKTGLLNTSQVCENARMQYLKYDNELYFEPDGSTWVHVFHHNNPAGGQFGDIGTTAPNSIYIDQDRWFNVQVADQLSSWEILVKTKATSSSEEEKYRWIQPANPMTCAYTDVTKDKVTWITTSGYSSRISGWGGLFKKKSSTYLAMDNNSNGSSWWGAVGAYIIFQGGIPGFSASVTTTGYLDLYLRIDNQNFTDLSAAMNSKYNMWLAPNFIES